MKEYWIRKGRCGFTDGQCFDDENYMDCPFDMTSGDGFYDLVSEKFCTNAIHVVDKKDYDELLARHNEFVKEIKDEKDELIASLAKIAAEDDE